MITDYFEAPWRIERMRATCVGPYIDGFASMLADAGYKHFTIRGYLRAADHLGRWADRRRVAIRSWDDGVLVRFGRHLPRCKCIKANKGLFVDAIAGARLLLKHLRACAVIASEVAPPKQRYAALIEEFAAWMVRHRGLAPSSLALYQRNLQPFVDVLGEDPSRYTVSAIRGFVVARLGDAGRGKARSAATAIRAFLRFLVAEGRVPAELQRCVPTVPEWRLSSLPRYLEAPDVERLLRSCDQATDAGLRDYAILLLLARLGLRAGDIVAMTTADIDWCDGSLRVHGKGRREVRLPLPQDVGDAILAYVERGRPTTSAERLFLRVRAPRRPFSSSAAVSDVVRAALDRAGIENAPIRGAHLLRHSAATAMLRAGASLDSIASVLRHRSPDTTAIYAKVDVAMLQEVTQPWPGGTPC